MEVELNVADRLAVVEVVGGSLGGMLSRIVEYPLDTIKVQQQISNQRGIWSTLTKIWKEGGTKNIYRGVGPPIFFSAIENAICFPVYAAASGNALARKDHPNASLTFQETLACGAATGFVVAHALTPLELIKCRMQAGAIRATDANTYHSSFDCLKKTIVKDGVRALYRGHVSTLCREVPGNAALFATYETVVPMFGENGGMVSAICGGGLAGLLYFTIPYPMDTVKSAMQTAHGPPKTFMQTFKELAVQRKLYHGLGVTLLRAVPGTAVIFLTVENVRSMAQCAF